MTNTATAARGPQPAPASSRMTLAAVHKGKRRVPDRILLYGVEGVGKSTFGADAPNPIFIAGEEGVSHLDVASFPQPESFDDVLGAVRVLIEDQHDYKTVVFDTADWIEPLVWESICKRNNCRTIEDPGYGKGYNITPDEWRKLLAALERLQERRGMEVIFLAHAAIRNFSNPAGQDYARYEIKLHKFAAALIKEWCRSNLFAMHEEFAQKDKGQIKAKGVSTGRRVIYTERTAAYDAKNRDGLPPELPLSYADFAAARESGQPASPEKLRTEALALLEALSPEPEKRAQIASTIEKAGTNATMLAKCADRLRTLVAEKENAQ